MVDEENEFAERKIQSKNFQNLTLVSVLKALMGKWRKQGELTESCGDLTFKKKLRDAMEDVTMKSGFHMRYLFCVNVF